MVRPGLAFLLSTLFVLGACGARSGGEPNAATVATLEALVNGRALDGREGLALYAPSARDAAFERLVEEVRAWSGTPEDARRLDGVLGRDDGSDAGRGLLYEELLALRAEVMTFTETFYHPGLADVTLAGEAARAERVGEDPGGEFRETVRFARIGATWYLDLP